MRGLLVFVAVTAAFASCVGSEVTQIGPQRPARPLGCPVQIVPGTSAAPLVDLASVRANCPAAGSRDDCFDELRRQACALGGDTVHSLSESVSGGMTYIVGMVAWRGQSGPEAPGAARNGAGLACTPICSPGFDCQVGRCVPLCNPACALSEICNQHRTCEPSPAAGSTPGAGPAGHASDGGH
jgi:hypothetical protein